jgi:spore coat polysaccharide biosynthesis protein SpsF
MRIQGKSILERAVERLRAAGSLDGVVVLTTEHDEDEVIVKEAHRLKVDVFRGPDADVLARFRLAADRFQPEVIVRATADNPLIDIGSVDRTVTWLVEHDLDYCLEAGMPVGAATEAITKDALVLVDRLGNSPHHREHVTTYLKEHSQDFRVAFLHPPEPLRRPDVRITVDTPEDFAFVAGLIQALPDGEHPRPLADYLPARIPDPLSRVPSNARVLHGLQRG